MTEAEPYIKLESSQGVHQDLWLDQTACLTVVQPPDAHLEVQLWAPDDLATEHNSAEGRKLTYSVAGEERHVAMFDKDIISIVLPPAPEARSPRLWIGTSFWRLIFDDGEEKRGRRVATRIHAVLTHPAGQPV